MPLRRLRSGSSIEKEESVTAWFYRVLRNAIVDHYRVLGLTIVETTALAV